ncbi:hypothetical protein [Phenylobacterium sp.]|uniref:hypothetical protein n=1 Tax=Phenylobacterium sp. TaxID=1871053 RepID=UPI00271616B4|nr:hypothetical protein [Phenylobacterium sp.]MDO8379215.1 hypothetical protein [Phenylobacterium sp.]
MKTTSQTRRDVMNLAWGLYRAEAKGPNPRSFSDALAGAWRFMKRRAERLTPAWAKGSAPRQIRFASMVSSPIARSLSGQVYAGVRAASAGYHTSRFGA